MTDSTVEPEKRVGRPKDSDLAPDPDRKRPGPKAGDAAIMKWYKSRMLASEKSHRVFEAVLKTAADPDHKHFTACAKMVMDRLLPIGAFDKESGKGSGGVNVTISVVGGDVKVDEEAQEAEFEEIDVTPGTEQ